MLDLHDCSAHGSAFTEPFLRFELGNLLARHRLLSTPPDGWDAVRRKLNALGGAAGPLRVFNHVITPLAPHLGYAAPVRQEDVATREGAEDAGWLLNAPDGSRLRAWSVGTDTDLDTPHRSGRAYRFSPARAAQRVLLACNERAGLLTDGDTLRLLLSDPARSDSHIVIRLMGDGGWRSRREPPDSYRALTAIARPSGLAALPAILDAARLSQVRVTRALRVQAREGLEGFIQALLDQHASRHPRDARKQPDARTLWNEGLILVYRLLFILKLESTADPARAFSFASTALWRAALSPNQALGPLVRRHLDHGHATGTMLESGLRTVFRIFRDGVSCSELSVAPLGGALFGADTTPVLDRLAWGEKAVAILLDRLLWTRIRGGERARVQYSALGVEDLGGIYEALLELEPGIADAPMVRLRRATLEAVVPADSEAASQGRVEDIPRGRFFLRAGLARKATGSFYTPHGFVHFLVRESLGPAVRTRSPDHDPNPGALLALRVLDPAVGSGHFLVEACRYLGEALCSACRLCDEQAAAAEARAAEARAAGDPARSAELLERANTLRRRIAALPDLDGTLVAYLPSRTRDTGQSGVSQQRALAICRRLVAVHCLYGVDRNKLAIELAKLSLWLESYAEGLPLTFLDHRVVQGDSIAGPLFVQLATLPVGGQQLDPLLAQGVAERLDLIRQAALNEVHALESSIGKDVADLTAKSAAKRRLDTALHPLLDLARAWAGGAALGTREADDEWLALARAVADTGTLPPALTGRQQAMLETGHLALPWDLAFPEVFSPNGSGGFDAILGNPPWDVIQHSTKDFVAGHDPRVLDAPTKMERARIERRVLSDPDVARDFATYKLAFEQQKRLAQRLFHHQRVGVGSDSTAGNLDAFRLFAERTVQLAAQASAIGMVMPSAFHANEGSTGIRRLFLRRTSLECWLSFENRRKLFDIDSRFKFALIVARVPGPTRTIRCAFYLEAIEQMADLGRVMTYDLDFLTRAGGGYLTPLELRGDQDLAVAQRMFSCSRTLGEWWTTLGLHFGRDLHMTDDAPSFVRIGSTEQIAGERNVRRRESAPAGSMVLHEGKTFHQFTDRWNTAPRYMVPAEALAARPLIRHSAGYYRAVFRDIARSSDEHTMIAAVAPPGTVFGHTATVERSPDTRPDAAALAACALLNSFPFDWLVRQKAAAHLSLYLVGGLPVPTLPPAAFCFLAHAALRLCCNHAGYAPLWQAQLGPTWREKSSRFAWPAVGGAEARWQIRAEIDAVVAHAYGLTAAHYTRVLGAFSHKSFPTAPALCQAAYDDCARMGVEQFCQGRDPYAATALITTLPGTSDKPAAVRRPARLPV
ncbi:MAG TPA: hypothetical protein VIG49_14265 [Acetobacteraceae bacterium]